MSRGGKGGTRGRGGGGGRRTGPAIAWDDEPLTPLTTKPEPLFPEIDLATPKPLSEAEIERVDNYLDFRDAVRNGPLYTILDPSKFTDDQGKVNKRAGFDAFNNVERYSSRFHRQKRTVPDLSGREYVLKFFPRELWSTVDPHKTNPAWKSLDPSDPQSALSMASKSVKRKRAPLPPEEDSDPASGSDSDDVLTSRRRRRLAVNGASGRSTNNNNRYNDDPTKRRGQKPGLEAEDDIPEIEQNEDEGDGDNEVPQDSEFSESDDGAGDDYNAENYFDGGEEDDFDDAGGGGEDTYD